MNSSEGDRNLERHFPKRRFSYSLKCPRLSSNTCRSCLALAMMVAPCATAIRCSAMLCALQRAGRVLVLRLFEVLLETVGKIVEADRAHRANLRVGFERLLDEGAQQAALPGGSAGHLDEEIDRAED